MSNKGSRSHPWMERITGLDLRNTRSDPNGLCPVWFLIYNRYSIKICWIDTAKSCGQLPSERGPQQPQWTKALLFWLEYGLRGYSKEKSVATPESHACCGSHLRFPEHLLHRLWACPWWLQSSGIHRGLSPHCAHIPVWVPHTYPHVKCQLESGCTDRTGGFGQ